MTHAPPILAKFDADLFNLVFGVGTFVFFLLLGLIFGRATERKHLASIAQRNAEMTDFLVTDVKTLPGADAAGGGLLVTGEVVVGSDYLKTWLSAMRNIFGGEMRSFERLLFRAREEAKLRMMAEAKRLGYNAICNYRIDFVGLGGSAARGKGAPMAGIIVSGTAYVIKPV